jgi:hypothetical protein
MGLDMYAYAAVNEKQYDEYWNEGQWDNDSNQFVSEVTKPKELAYWRKHPNLHGWLEQEWRSNQYSAQPADASKPVDPDTDQFNNVQLEITWDMLERLEYDVINGELPGTSGFFFGSNADADYYQQDLEFIKNARAELFLGLRVFYNSSW